MTMRYAVLIDYHTEGLHYVTRPTREQVPGDPRATEVHEVETIAEALVLAADHACGSPWEVVARIDVRTTPGSMAEQAGLYFGQRDYERT